MGEHSRADRSAGARLKLSARAAGLGRMLGGVVASGVLVALYARGAWPVGFVMLVPWLVALAHATSAGTALASGAAMSLAYVAAAFVWFAPAVADYTGLPGVAALGLLLLMAPVLQPQLLAFALTARLASRHRSVAWRITFATAAWLAAEWALPRVFGDTPGIGLQPSALMRQGADLAGVSGLTLVLLLANQLFAEALRRIRDGGVGIARPAMLALALPFALAGYGTVRLAQVRAGESDAPLRIGVVQSAIVDYERLRREHGAYATVRQVLDAHYARSTQLRASGAEALVWPETVYPTTLGQPQNEVGAELDDELYRFVKHIGVPLVLGTYERDAAGEYNVAAFVDPSRGRLGAYRKTRLFPLTEYVPPSIDGPLLRRWLPWAGTWRRGDGARVFPLFVAGGREVPVGPLICRDDVDPAIARDAARLGARALVALSNDSWFTRAPQGAALHLAVASFRSVETRLPQVRATTNGISAVIDAEGNVVARTSMAAPATLLATIRPRAATGTLFLRAGSWLGPASLLVLAAGVVAAAWRGRGARVTKARVNPAARQEIGDWPVLLLTPWQRALLAALRTVSLSAVLLLGFDALLRDTPPTMLWQLRQFAIWVVLPTLGYAVMARTTRARLSLDAARLVLRSRSRTVEIDRIALADVLPWRLPVPMPGIELVLRDGGRWSHAVGSPAAGRFLDALLPADDAETMVDAGGSPGLPAHDANAHTAPPSELQSPAEPPSGNGAVTPVPSRHRAWLRALDTPRWWCDHPSVKFALFPLVPALPAFRLHQVIAYGGPFGELQTFGPAAYFTALVLWWASWVVALVLIAGGLRALVEIISTGAVLIRPGCASRVRKWLLAATRAVYFIGVPAWLALRMTTG